MDTKPKIRCQGRILPCRDSVFWISQPLSRPTPIPKTFAAVITISYQPPIFIIISTFPTPYMAPVCWVKNFSTSAAMVLTTKMRPSGPIRWPSTHSLVDTELVVALLSIKGLSNKPPASRPLFFSFVFMIYSTSTFIVTGSQPADFTVTLALPGTFPARSTARHRPR